MSPPKRSLENLIHKSLTWRLAIAGVVLSLLLAVVIYVVNRDSIGDAVVARMEQAIEMFGEQLAISIGDSVDLNPDLLQAEVNRYASAPRLGVREGKFVFSAVYDLSGNQLAAYVAPEHEISDALKSKISPPSRHVMFQEDVTLEVVRTRVDVLAHLYLPLRNSKGEIIANVEGFFAVSPEVRADIRWRIIRGTVLGVMTILLTTAVIYPLIVNLLGRVSKLTLELLDSNLETLQVLGSAIAKRDSDTDAHNYRVTIFSVRLAEAACLEPVEIQKLIKGAFLHDVGKIAIRDKILLKPGPLDEDEFTVMRTHVEHGADIINRSTWLDDARDVVVCHHEKYDGSGYPKGLSGKTIPVNARIFAIADVFDALTSKRPYKEPFRFEKSINILKEGKGHHFDPLLVDLFVEIADSLYKQLSGEDGSVSREQLSEIIDCYFNS